LHVGPQVWSKSGQQLWLVKRTWQQIGADRAPPQANRTCVDGGCGNGELSAEMEAALTQQV